MPPLPSGYSAATNPAIAGLSYADGFTKFHLVITLSGAAGPDTPAIAVVPVQFIDLSPSSSPTPSRTAAPRSPSRTPIPTQSPGASPSSTPSGTPSGTPSPSSASEPFYSLVQDVTKQGSASLTLVAQWQWDPNAPTSAAVNLRALVRSAPQLSWVASVAAGASGQTPSWLQLGSGAHKQGSAAAASLQQLQLQLAGPSLVPGVYRATVTVQVDTSRTYPGDGRAGRLSSASLAPLSIRVVLTVTAPKAVLSPSVLEQSVLPGDGVVVEVLVQNTGGGSLSFAVSAAAQPAWLGFCNTTTSITGALRPHVCVGAVSALSPAQSSTAVPGVQSVTGSAAAASSSTLLVLLQPARNQSGVFPSQLQISTNEFSASDRVTTRLLGVNMRATLSSIVPRVVSITGRPGETVFGRVIVSDISLDADLLVQVLAPSAPSTAGRRPWLQVLTNQPSFRLPASNGQGTVQLAVRIGTSSNCSAMPPGVVCGAAGVHSTELKMELRAVPLPNIAGSALASALFAYFETVTVPVQVTVVAGAASSRSQLGIPANAAAMHPRLLSQVKQIVVKDATGANIFVDVVPANLPGVSFVVGESAGLAAVEPRDLANNTIAKTSRQLPNLVQLTRDAAQSKLSSRVISAEKTVALRVGPLGLGNAAAHVTLRGHALGSSGPSGVLVLGPTCDAPSQQLSTSRLECVCAGGYARTVGSTVSSAGTGSGLRCTACPTGQFRLPEADPAEPCLPCPSGQFALASGKGCSQCPASHVDCGSGTATIDNGFWCETCVSDLQYSSGNSELAARHRSALSSIQREHGVPVASTGASRRQLQDEAGTSTPAATLVSADSVLLQCSPADACERRSSNGSSTVVCAEGHRGVLCGECRTGWVRAGSEAMCAECPDGNAGLVQAIATSLILGIVVVYLAVKPASSSRGPGAMYSGVFRILLTWGQTLGVLRAARLPPRSSMDAALDAMSGLSVGVSTSSPQLQCLTQLGFYNRLCVSLALPLGAMLLPYLTVMLYWAAAHTLRKRPNKASSRLRPVLQPAQQPGGSKALQPATKHDKAPPSGGAAAAVLAAPDSILDDTAVRGGTVTKAAPQHSDGQHQGRGAWDSSFRAAEQQTESATHISMASVNVGPAAARAEETPHVKLSPKTHLGKPTRRFSRREVNETALRITLVLLLLLHFGIVETCLRALDTLDTPMFGFTFLRADVSVGSFDGAAFSFGQLLAVLGLLVWGFGIPTLGAVVLYRNRRRLHSSHTIALYGSLYEGMRVPSPEDIEGASAMKPVQLRAALGSQPNFWYWELLVAIPRKLLLAIAVAAIRTPALQASVILMVLSTALVLQMAAAPYVTRSLNALETLSLAVLWLTAFSGLVLADGDDLAQGVVVAVEGLVAGVNLTFLVGTATVVVVAFAASVAASRRAAGSWVVTGDALSEHEDDAAGLCCFWPCRYGTRRGCTGWLIAVGAMEPPVARYKAQLDTAA